MADIGIAGGAKGGILFKKGKLLDALFFEIDKLEFN